MSQLSIQQAFELALQHHQAGRLQEAEQIYRQILALQPDHLGATHYLAVTAHQFGRNDAATELVRRVLALRPDYPDAHSLLGLILRAQGRLDEAVVAQRKAIALQPTYAEAHSNLGNALKDLARIDEAIAAYRQAIAISPDFADAHTNLGDALRGNGQLEEAIAEHRKAVALKPSFAEAHYNLADALLARGDFQEGWKELEWRWKCKDFPSPRRNFSQPQWDGSPLQDRTLLIHTEQGFGDSIQFIRYLPLLARHGGKIIIECQPELERIFQTLPKTPDAGFRIVVKGQPLPSFDLHCPLLSLPMVFKTTPQSIPADVPYLFPDPQLVQSWRKNLIAPQKPASSTGFNVALAWAGSPDFKGDRTRSLTLDRLSPLRDVRGATFYSIQKDDAARQINHPPAGLHLINLAPQLIDFADTAAALSLMDLVITTDTSVAHLAGALGRPVWVMLQFVPDWRWLVERKDSPWYPSMRLFRQHTPGDWSGVIASVAHALAVLCSQTHG